MVGRGPDSGLILNSSLQRQIITIIVLLSLSSFGATYSRLFTHILFILFLLTYHIIIIIIHIIIPRTIIIILATVIAITNFLDLLQLLLLLFLP